MIPVHRRLSLGNVAINSVRAGASRRLKRDGRERSEHAPGAGVSFHVSLESSWSHVSKFSAMISHIVLPKQIWLKFE